MGIPGFKLIKIITSGGMATVYLGIQTSLGRKVVLKVLNKFDNKAQSNQFLAEGKIVAALNHKNIITIHDIGKVKSRHYIAMEYLRGGSLADKIKHGISTNRTLDIMEDIGSCLQYVHRHNVIHRDVKPGNILFHKDGTPKLTDFGIAKQISADQEDTMDTDSFGSPYYISPEQAQGKPLDNRTDLYGLGIIFYEMLTGQKPYIEESHVQTMVAHLNKPVPIFPKKFSKYQNLLNSLIAKSPDDRFSSAGEMVGYIRGLRVEKNKGSSRSGKISLATTWLSNQYFSLTPKVRIVAIASALFIGSGIGLISSDNSSPPRLIPKAPVESQPAIKLNLINGQVIASAVESPIVDNPVVENPVVEYQAVEHTVVVPRVVVHPGEDHHLPPPEIVSQKINLIKGENSETLEIISFYEPETPSASVETETGHLSAIEEYLAEAELAIDEYRLSRPSAYSALYYYDKIAELDPNLPAIAEGRQKIADYYAAMAYNELSRNNYDAARLYVNRGMQVRPFHEQLVALQQKINSDENPVLIQGDSTPSHLQLASLDDAEVEYPTIIVSELSMPRKTHLERWRENVYNQGAEDRLGDDIRFQILQELP